MLLIQIEMDLLCRLLITYHDMYRLDSRVQSSEEMILREAEAEMYQERITGELGASVRVADDGAGTKEGVRTTTAKPKSASKPNVQVK